MLQTIEIYRESGKRRVDSYRAISGQRQAKGKTPGQALDSLEKMLAPTGETASSVIILQRFQPDEFFLESQQRRLQALMMRFHETIQQDGVLTPDERAELEQLVDMEWIAAIARTTNILAQINRPSNP